MFSRNLGYINKFNDYLIYFFLFNKPKQERMKRK